MLLLVGLGFAVQPFDVLAQEFVYRDASLKRVIDDLQDRGGYRFLYRDALIQGKTVSLTSEDESVISSLQEALRSQALDLRYDVTRRQVLLFPSTTAPVAPVRPSVVKGHVVDAESGVRLPYAHVTWMYEGQLRGVSTNDAGVFFLPVSSMPLTLRSQTLTVTYLGYRPMVVQVDLDALPASLDLRLEPMPVVGDEVLVSSSTLHSDLDTTWHHLLQGSLVSPLGESSVIRSLQPLPAVSVSNAFAQGLNVRGNKSDGFQVLLDGIPIYNQQHLFGMFDVFNADALQSVGFFMTWRRHTSLGLLVERSPSLPEQARKLDSQRISD